MIPALVIFDCDGVLVDSEPITNRMIAEEMTAAGLPMTTEQSIEMFVGGTIAGVYAEAVRRGAHLREDWVDYYYDRMIEVLAEEVEAIPGVHAALDALDHAGVQYCVGSNGPVRKMAATLGRTGLWNRLVGRLYSAHDVGVAKPDPGLFLHAARAQGATPETCIVVEDSASGARAARAAGMRCLGFVRDTPAEKLTAEGAEPFDDMAALPALLGLTA